MRLNVQTLLKILLILEKNAISNKFEDDILGETNMKIVIFNIKINDNGIHLLLIIDYMKKKSLFVSINSFIRV